MSHIFDISKGTPDAERLFNGVNNAARVICSTMGAYGHNNIIDQQSGFLIHKDGVTAARYMSFEDPLENLGAKMLVDAAYQTVKSCGDGTTGTSALLRDLLKRILVDSDNYGDVSVRNKHIVAKGMEKAAGIVEEWINSKKELISNDTDTARQQLSHIGTISANNNREIGEKVGGLIAECGRNAIISVTDSHDSVVRFERKSGYVMDSGWVTPHFVNNKNMTASFGESLVCIFNEKLSADEDVIRIMEHWRDVNMAILQRDGADFRDMGPELFSARAMPLVIVCPDIEGDALNTVIANLPQNRKEGAYVKCVVLSMPVGGSRRDDLMSDLAVVTGVHRIIDSMRGQLKTSFGKGYQKQDLKTIYGEFGVTKSVEAHKGKTSFGHDGQTREVFDRIEGLNLIDLSDKDDNFISFIEERIARLSGGIGNISVGAYTETEQKQLKLLIDDAQLACLTAYKHGFVVGGGAILHKFKEYEGFNYEDFSGDDEYYGAELVLSVLDSPINTMWENSGLGIGYMYGEINQDMYREEHFSVFDMIKMVQLDGSQRTIIDPANVPIQSLKNAVSVAAKVLTSKYVTM
jgi:chaperonin GroEL